jgi:hypothetical protein
MIERMKQFRARWARVVMGLVMGLMMLGANQARAITLTNATATDLKIALITGGTIKLVYTVGSGTISTTTPFVIQQDNTIIDATGVDVTISGGGTTRIFDVPTNIHFFATNLTISGGRNLGSNGVAGAPGVSGFNNGTRGGNGTGGSNGFGGAIRNQGTTTLINCLLVTNTATGGTGGNGGNGGDGSFQPGDGGTGGSGGMALGGAIYNTGTLVLSNCTLAGNQALGGLAGVGGTNGLGPAGNPGSGGSGGAAFGGAVYNLGSATFINCTINQSLASGADSQPGGGPPLGSGDGAIGPVGGIGEGGGIFSQGTVSFVNCTFFANVADGGKGGSGGSAGSGLGHGGTGGAGGTAIGGSICTAGTGTLSLTNCTFSTDSASGGAGGTPGTGPFLGNNGPPGGSLGASVANTGGGTVILHNDILAYPTSGTLAYGTITDQGNNISSDGTPTFTTTNSFRNRDPLLFQSLEDNSGPTLTIGLYPGSPAIDNVFDSSAPATDQRLLARPVGARSDSGAFEFGATPTNFSLSGFVSLAGNPLPGVTVKADATSAVTDTNGAYTIVLGAGIYSVTPQPTNYFTPASTQVNLTNNVTGVNFTVTNLPVTIGRVSSNGTSVQMTFSAIPNLNYRIQASTNLVTWTNLATNNAGSNGAISFNTSITNFPKRFFRAITP